MTVEYNKRMNQTLEQKLCQMEEKYSKLVWYARNREGAFTAMKEVEENYPNESARLNGELPGFISDEMNEELKKQIDKVEIFHKVDFSRHLGIGVSICTCLHCGFHDKEIDPIQCCINHKPPCKDCQRSFEVSCL